MSMPLTLKVFKGDSLVGSKEFSRDIIKIGRLSSAHLCLDDEKVSRIHSVIEVSQDNQISIIDMGSAEGTFVNGTRVNKGALAQGDEIRIGGVRLVLEILQPQAMAPPPAAVAAVPAIAAAVAAAPALAPELAPRAPAVAVVASSVAAAPAPTLARAAARPPPPPPMDEAPVSEGVYGLSRKSTQSIPVSPAIKDAGRTEGVEFRLFWDTTLVGSTFQERPAELLIGDTDRCAFQVPADKLPVPEFPVVTAKGERAFLIFDRTMEGELELGGFPPKRLSELVTARSASTADRPKGCFQVELPAGSFAWVQIGALRAEVTRKPVPRKALAPFWRTIDYQWLNTLLLMAFGMLAFVIAAVNFPIDTDTTADDLFRNHSAMAKFIVKPPEKSHSAWVERLKAAGKKGGEGDPGEMAEKHKGKEGKMGKKAAPVRNARSAPKAIDINAKEQVKASGLLRAMGAGGGLSTILGSGGLGGDLRGAIGNMFGPTVGDAQGLGGLGLRGTGQGGSGVGNPIGVGDIGTKGRGGGLAGYGSGMGIGSLGHKKQMSDIAISSGNPTVEGSLDKELIRRVINAHRNQVRFCYESELVRHPGMNGKVTVKFIIGANGLVQKSGLDASTLGNGNVEGCIVSRVTQWEFQKPKGGGIVVVSYPFLLKESGE